MIAADFYDRAAIFSHDRNISSNAGPGFNSLWRLDQRSSNKPGGHFRQ